MTMDRRAKLLLSDDARPRVTIPVSSARSKRTFRLPTDVSAPRARSASELAANGDVRFRDRTMTWFREGDELGDEPIAHDDYEPARAGWHRTTALAAAAAALVVVVSLAIIL